MTRNALTCVAYHHLGDGAQPLVDALGVTTPPATFRAHVEWYRRNYRIVDLDCVLAGNLPSRALLITFDDAYRSVLDHALPVLRAHRLPAVLFTNPAGVAMSQVALDNVLALFVHRFGVEALASNIGAFASARTTLAAVIASHVSQMSLTARDELKARLLAALGVSEAALHAGSRLFMGARDVRALAEGGIEIANHTQSHVHCRCLTADEIEAEVVTSKAMIEELAGRPVRAFSFPYGNEQDATPAVVERVRSSGHLAQFLVHARSNRVRPAADVWYRTSLTDAPVAELNRRLHLMPGLRTLRAEAVALLARVRPPAVASSPATAPLG